jgi:hypothetical protein
VKLCQEKECLKITLFSFSFRAQGVERFLIGKNLSTQLLAEAIAKLSEDVDPAIESFGKDVDVRKSLVRNFLFKFVHSADAFFHNKVDDFPEKDFPITKGVQTFVAKNET